MTEISAIIASRSRTEGGRGGYLDAKANLLAAIAATVADPAGTGLSAGLAAFWTAVSRVVDNSSWAAATHDAVTREARGVVGALNTADARLTQLASELEDLVARAVTEANAAASGIAAFNAAIAAAETEATALRAQRGALTAQLAYLSGAETEESPDGAVTVTLGGRALVAGQALSAAGVDPMGNVVVGGAVVTLASGSAQARAEDLMITLPRYQAWLDRVASALASDGGFFTGTTAATIAVAPTWAADASGAEFSDGPDAVFRELVATIAAEHRTAAVQSALQASVTPGVRALRRPTGDELTDLLADQRDALACSQTLTAVEYVVETLRSGLGLARGALLPLPSPAVAASVETSSAALVYEKTAQTLAKVRQTSMLDFVG